MHEAVVETWGGGGGMQGGSHFEKWGDTAQVCVYGHGIKTLAPCLRSSPHSSYPSLEEEERKAW